MTPAVRLARLDPSRPAPELIAEAARVLRSGGLVAFPTETVYGLGARAFDPSAIRRIFAAKGRPTHHPLIVHVLGETDAALLAANWSEVSSRLARAFWPGPLTLVVPRATGLPSALGAGTESVGIRAPAHPVARALLVELGEPIAAPSANRYQGVSPTLAAHVMAALGDRVDLVLDGGPCAHGLESTVVDVRASPPLILRPGAIDRATLATVVPTVTYGDLAPSAGEARASPGMDLRHYAPKARLYVLPSRDEALAAAGREAGAGRTVGVVLWGDAERAAAEGVVVKSLPDDPSGYARKLYATLHELDGAGVGAVFVQAVPAEEAWCAVADRLARASAGA